MSLRANYFAVLATQSWEGKFPKGFDHFHSTAPEPNLSSKTLLHRFPKEQDRGERI